MSLDLAVWKGSSAEARESYELAADGECEHFLVSAGVIFFRGALLRAWPEMADMVEPDEDEAEVEPDILSRYVLLTLSWGYADKVDAIVRLAQEHELVVYDPQSEAVLSQPR
jgi:hypothetical protein